MSVPRQAVMEEPSTEPLSPRGTCLDILTHVALLYASPLPWHEGCSSTQSIRAQGSAANTRTIRITFDFCDIIPA